MRGLIVGVLGVGGVVVLMIAPASGEWIQWTLESGGNGHFYQPVSIPDGITWSAANAAATAMGGYLASITSAEENAFVFGLVSDDAYWHHSGADSDIGPWLGGFQPPDSPEPSGNWQWVSGEPFVYNNWGTGQPNNVVGYGNEDRIHFYGPNDVRASFWNDLPGDTAPAALYIKGYIVESVPEPSAFLLLGIGAINLLGYAWRRRMPMRYAA